MTEETLLAQGFALEAQDFFALVADDTKADTGLIAMLVYYTIPLLDYSLSETALRELADEGT